MWGCLCVCVGVYRDVARFSSWRCAFNLANEASLSWAGSGGASPPCSPVGIQGQSPWNFLDFGPFWMLGKHCKIVYLCLIHHKIFLLEWKNMCLVNVMLNTYIHVTCNVFFRLFHHVIKFWTQNSELRNGWERWCAESEDSLLQDLVTRIDRPLEPKIANQYWSNLD